MLYQWIRVIDGTEATKVDVSIDNQDESRTLSLDLELLEYFYIGQHFPFNNLYFQNNTVNSVTSNLVVEYWSGTSNGWKPAVDMLDGTSVSGATMARSGVVQWSPDRAFNWQKISDTEDEPLPAGLEAFTIYNIYWMRISVSVNLTSGTILDRIAYAFTQSQELDNIDTQINQFQDSFTSGKTDWNDEVVSASYQVVIDLRRRGLITHQGQILRFEDVTYAATLKALSLIYQNLGPGFRVKLEDARNEYERALNIKRFTFDKTNDAFVNAGEITNTIGALVR